jgi:hypothetical protein
VEAGFGKGSSFAVLAAGLITLRGGSALRLEMVIREHDRPTGIRP